MSLVESIKKHWLGGAISLASTCIVAAWFTSNELLVKPRDFTIEQQRATIENLEKEIKSCQAKVHELENQLIGPVNSGREPPRPLIECRLSNLIHCSVFVPIFTPGSSHCTIALVAGNAVINFRNDQTWSGVAFQFTPALDVQGFTRLDISGTATQQFTFRIEYKVQIGGNVVKSSSFHDFPATRQVSTIQVPLKYNGTVAEITLMFYQIGERSQVTIESIFLKPVSR